MVKNLPAIQETQVQSLGWEDPLEKGMATHSTILAWEIPWTEKPGGYSARDHKRVRHGLATRQQLLKRQSHLQLTKLEHSARPERSRTTQRVMNGAMLESEMAS